MNSITSFLPKLPNLALQDCLQGMSVLMHDLISNYQGLGATETKLPDEMVTWKVIRETNKCI